MNELRRVLGGALLIGGLYLLGKDIVFTTRLAHGLWNGIAALGSVLALIAGVLWLLMGNKQTRNLGWIAIVAGVVLVFAGSRAVLNPVSLWQFLAAFGCMAGGYKLLRE